MKRSSVPLLLLAGGVAWTVGQAVLPDMGLEWEARLDAVAAARPTQALSSALFVVAGALLVCSAIAAARRRRSGRGAGAIALGTLLLGLGGIWLAAGRGAFNLQMYRLTDPDVGREAAVAIGSADVGLGFLPLILTLPALLLGPVVLAVGLLRAGAGGRLPLAGLVVWVLGIGTFMASEFTVKAGETAGIAVAAAGLTLLGAALAPTGERGPARDRTASLAGAGG